MAAAIKARNNGCGRRGRDFSSGWNCVPMKNGCPFSSMISTSPRSGFTPDAMSPRFSRRARNSDWEVRPRVPRPEEIVVEKLLAPRLWI